MRWEKYLLLISLLVYLAVNIFTHRSLFFSKFDEVYWKDKYEQSQWLLPLSWRIIGDDGLYLYEGYKIIHGYNPTLVNAEVPPLPKYLIGLSILIFGNGHWYGAVFTSGSVILFYLLSLRLLGNKTIAASITFLFALDPLLVEQFPLTMIDSIQLFFLLLFFLFLTYFPERHTPRKRTILVIATGAALGLFSNTRFPILTPFALVIAGYLLWRYQYNIRSIAVFLITTFLFYLLPYAWYFALGHTFTDWLGVQKWIFTFYRSSKLQSNFGSIWTVLLGNRYQNLFTHTHESVQEWTPVWTIITVGGILGFAKAVLFDKNNVRHVALLSAAVFLLSTVAFYTIIPFWTRYLLLVIPFLYLGFGYFLPKLNRRVLFPLVGLLVFINFFVAARILIPTPESTVRAFVYAFQNGFFQDLYENITPRAQAQSTREVFYKKGLSLLRNGQIESTYIKMPDIDWYRFLSPQYVPIQITYYTRNLGPVTQRSVLPVILEDGQWRIQWTWQLFLSDLPDDGTLDTAIDPARRGSIILQSKNSRIDDFPNSLIWITPGQVDPARETDMLQTISGLFSGRIPETFLHHRYVFNTDPDYPVPIGVPPAPITTEIKSRLLLFPGVTLTPAYGRKNVFHEELSELGNVKNSQFLECCSNLYSATTYDGATGIEKEKNEILKGINGGTLVIKDKNGTIIRTILAVEKREGKDIKL